MPFLLASTVVSALTHLHWLWKPSERLWSPRPSPEDTESSHIHGNLTVSVIHRSPGHSLADHGHRPEDSIQRQLGLFNNAWRCPSSPHTSTEYSYRATHPRTTPVLPRRYPLRPLCISPARSRSSRAATSSAANALPEMAIQSYPQHHCTPKSARIHLHGPLPLGSSCRLDPPGKRILPSSRIAWRVPPKRVLSFPPISLTGRRTLMRTKDRTAQDQFQTQPRRPTHDPQQGNRGKSSRWQRHHRQGLRLRWHHALRFSFPRNVRNGVLAHWRPNRSAISRLPCQF